jgi:hypothetical protein
MWMHRKHRSLDDSLYKKNVRDTCLNILIHYNKQSVAPLTGVVLILTANFLETQLLFCFDSLLVKLNILFT